MNNNEKNCKETILIQNEIDGTLLTSANQTGSSKKGRNKSNLADQVALIDLKTKNPTPSKQASTIKNKPNNNNNNNKKSNLKSEEDASLFKNNNNKIVENKDLESSSFHDIKNDDQSKLNVADKIKNKIYSAKKLDLKSNETQSILSDNSKQLPKLIIKKDKNSSNNQVFYLNNVPQTSTSQQQQQQQQQHQQFLETQNEIYNKKIVTSTEYKESDEMFKHYNLNQSSLISPNSKFKSTSSINLSTKCKLFITTIKYFYFSLKF